jgi:hypothetical protein
MEDATPHVLFFSFNRNLRMFVTSSRLTGRLPGSDSLTFCCSSF